MRRWIVASSRHPASTDVNIPCSLSIQSKVCNLGKFRNSIPLLEIFDRRLLTTTADPRPQTRCNRRARPKEKFRLHSRSLAPTFLCVLFICSYIPFCHTALKRTLIVATTTGSLHRYQIAVTNLLSTCHTTAQTDTTQESAPVESDINPVEYWH